MRFKAFFFVCMVFSVVLLPLASRVEAAVYYYSSDCGANIGYVGSPASCASNYCAGKMGGAGIGYENCKGDNIDICRPYGSRSICWTCPNSSCSSGEIVQGVGSGATCPVLSACDGCSGTPNLSTAGLIKCWQYLDAHGYGYGNSQDIAFCARCGSLGGTEMNCCGDNVVIPTPPPTSGPGPTSAPPPTSTPTPTNTPTPTPTLPAATGLTATCVPGNRVKLSWNGVVGADYYSLRVDGARSSWTVPSECWVSPQSVENGGEGQFFLRIAKNTHGG